MVTEHHQGFRSVKFGPEPEPVDDNVHKLKEPRFKMVPFDSITVGSEPVYLVKGIIPRSGLTVFYGPPKCGKSFAVLDLTMHIALGWEYRGRRVQQGSVVYITLEGTKGFQARVAAFRSKWLADHDGNTPFFLITANLDLVKDHGELIANIRAQSANPPAVVVIDTLNRSLSGSESSDEDMAAYVRAEGAIREALGCATIIVHHCGHEGTRPRGHSSLIGALDAQIAVKRGAGNTVEMLVEWMKEGPEGNTLVSKLDPVEVGMDSDGDPITSCVIVPVDEADIPEAKPKAQKLNARQKLALDALTEALLASGEPVPASFGLPAGLKSVTLDAWRKEIMQRGVIASDAGNPREEFRRLRDQLASKCFVGQRDGLVWKAG